MKRRAVRIVGVFGQGFGVDLVNAVGLAVQIEIQAKAEQMLVDRRSEIGGDKGCELRPLFAIAHRRDADDAG